MLRWFIWENIEADLIISAFSFSDYGLIAVQFFNSILSMYYKTLKNTKLYSIEFLRTEMTSDPSNYHREYSPYSSYSLFQFEGSDVISGLKNTIEYNFVFFKCLLKKNWNNVSELIYWKNYAKRCWNHHFVCLFSKHNLKIRSVIRKDRLFISCWLFGPWRPSFSRNWTFFVLVRTVGSSLYQIWKIF